jgi:ABC-type multidrug transport system ATPase subunit
MFPMMNGGLSLRFDDLAKRFDLRVVFKGVSGAAAPGEALVVAGPNGSGKSTLVAILCGLLRPTRGTVGYAAEGGDVLPRESWRHHIGVVAPSLALYEELTGLENLRFFGRLRGLDALESRCRECLQEVGLDPDRRTPVRGYSTGMTQRLKIAQAMLARPSLLFLDEPGSNLDPSGQDWLEGFVREVLDQGRTIVLATNDRREMSWGSRRVALAG